MCRLAKAFAEGPPETPPPLAARATGQNLKGLLLEPDSSAVLAQLSRAEVHAKRSEANQRYWRSRSRHHRSSTLRGVYTFFWLLISECNSARVSDRRAVKPLRSCQLARDPRVFEWCAPMHCSSLALSAKFAARDEQKEKSRGFSRRLQLPGTSMLEAMLQKRRTNVRTIRIVGIALVLTAILMTGGQFRSVPGRFVSVAHAAQTGCSNSSLRGNYGFQIKGTIVGLGPIGGIALSTFDGVGNFTQTDNVSVNGFPIVPNRPGSGTYNVNADCTGTETLHQGGGQVIHTTFVIAENGKEVFDEVTDPNLVVVDLL